MVSRQGHSAGFTAFRQHSGSLLRGIQDPMTLAWDLNSKGLIDSQVREQACLTTVTIQQRVSCILVALEEKIASDEAAFDTFLSVLSQDPVMEEMWQKLMDAKGTVYYNIIEIAVFSSCHTSLSCTPADIHSHGQGKGSDSEEKTSGGMGAYTYA